MGLVAAAITGRYGISPAGLEPNCVIAQTFGNHLNEDGNKVPGPVNEALARFVLDQVSEANPDMPLLLQREVATPFREMGGREPDLVVSEHAEPGQYLDSWEVLRQCSLHMDKERGLRFPEDIRPLIVAQAFHAGRVAAQAAAHGMQPVMWAGLPRQFNSRSTQWWTRSRVLWTPREIYGVLPLVGALRRQGKL